MLRARICGGALAVRLSANHRPAAKHWRFAREVKSDRTTVGFFFVGTLRAPRDPACAGFSPDPETWRGTSVVRRVVKY